MPIMPPPPLDRETVRIMKRLARAWAHSDLPILADVFPLPATGPERPGYVVEVVHQSGGPDTEFCGEFHHLRHALQRSVTLNRLLAFYHRAARKKLSEIRSK